jgi:hypothetical protein
MLIMICTQMSTLGNKKAPIHIEAASKIPITK